MPARQSAVNSSIPSSAADDTFHPRKSGGCATYGDMENTMLFISNAADDRAALRQIMSGLDWEFSAVENCHEAIDQLGRAQVSVILCESVLEDGTWKDILRHIDGSARPPRLIVTSRLADEYLWAEVLNLGGYDVLAKPFSQREICHVLTTISLCQSHPATAVRTAGAA